MKTKKRAPWMVEIMSILLERRGIKCITLAKELGVNHSTVYKWANGVAAPSSYYIERMARFLNVDYDELRRGCKGGVCDLTKPYLYDGETAKEEGVVESGEELQQKILDAQAARLISESTGKMVWGDLSSLVDEATSEFAVKVCRYTKMTPNEFIAQCVKHAIDNMNDAFIENILNMDEKKDIIWK